MEIEISVMVSVFLNAHWLSSPVQSEVAHVLHNVLIIPTIIIKQNSSFQAHILAFNLIQLMYSFAFADMKQIAHYSLTKKSQLSNDK